MNSLHATATVTSKGQVTLPKNLRHALGLDTGSKLSFDLTGSQWVLSRAGGQIHEDLAIASFLALMEKDLENGRRIRALPKKLAVSMLAALRQRVDHDEAIQGSVAL